MLDSIAYVTILDIMNKMTYVIVVMMGLNLLRLHDTMCYILIKLRVE